MDSEQYQRAYVLFMRTVDLSEAERRAVLDAECSNDSGLRAWVEQLIQEEGQDSPAHTTVETAIAELITSVTPTDAPVQLTPGTRIDRFVVEAHLGAGGSASVWRVRHQELGSLHALKVLHSTHPRLIKRFRREGQLQGRVRHRNVVAISDLVEVNGQPGLIMEYVDGPDLSQFIAQHTLSTDQIDALVAGILEGVAAIHSTGLTHRDLKPSNVLLSRQGDTLTPRVTDFGIARAADSTVGLTRTGVLMGTLSHMAPEQIRDARLADHRTDIWALGCILYRLACGRDAFVGDDNGDLITDILSGRCAPLPAALPRRWTHAIQAALAVSPDDRPQDCAALLEQWSGRPRPDSPFHTLTPLTTEKPPPTDSTSIFDDRNNLPAARSRFFGRQAALEGLESHLNAGERLISILGIGGLGKSRLSRELGRRVLQDWPGGVWLVSLAEARTQADIVNTTARVLGVPLGKQPDEQLTLALERRGPTLLLLDNFEQITQHAHQTVGRWLDAAPALRIIATSREPLHLTGELAYPLAPLTREEATALFSDRARRANPRLRLDDAQDTLHELVRLLDRLPLAIELAAARSRMLPPDRLLARMERRFDLLKSRSSERPHRQRTLRAALEWSWELLNETERAVLAQCSVFEGGLSLEAADSVLLAPDGTWIEEVLSELIDKSLLSSDPATGRMSMLMSVQQFAAEKRSGTGAEQRHGDFFAALSSRETPSLQELDNLRVACQRARHRGDADIACRCAVALSTVLVAQGPYRLGAVLVDEVLEMPTLTNLQHATLLQRSGELWMITGEPRRALQRIDAALQRARSEAAPVILERCLGSRGKALYWLGEMADAHQDLTEAAQRAAAIDQPADEAQWLAMLGQIDATQGRISEAKAMYQRALQKAPLPQRADVLGKLANLQRRQGSFAPAERHYRDAIDTARSLGHKTSEAIHTKNLGYLYRQQGHIDKAIDCYSAAVRIAVQAGNANLEASSIGQLGEAYHSRGELEPALKHYQEALRITEHLGDLVSLTIWIGNIGNIRLLQGDLEEATRCYTRALAIARQIKDRSNEALWLGNIGALLFRQGKLRACQEQVKQALVISRQLKDRRRCALWLGNLGAMSLQLGELEQAAAQLQEAHDIAAHVGLPGIAGNAMANLAELAFLRGATGDVWEMLDEAVATTRRAEDAAGLEHTLQTRGQLHARTHNLEAARRDITEALGLARQLQDPQEEGFLLLVLASITASQGDRPGSHALRSRGEALLKEHASLLWMTQARCWQARLALSTGDYAAAAAALSAAAAAADEMEMGPESTLRVAIRELEAHSES